ncbi:IS66 family insertion sequence element accessory protein TnpA [Methylohalobius crimeensis]|uniref:IS66 family insertion sequence element accessory protein TnpA n=1 Tax=Methylohalobius crimeensis TaxID=244365 RepID=UPI0038994DEB
MYPPFALRSRFFQSRGSHAPTEKEQFWQEHFDAWRVSGLSQAEYCKQHGLKFSHFAYWRTRNNKQRRKLVPLWVPPASGKRSVNHSLFKLDVPW